jgi:hypothetical protein
LSLLVIFRNLPPDAGGAATIIRNLFEFADDSVTIVGRKSRYPMDYSTTKYNKVEIPLSDRPESKWLKLKYFVQSALICLKVIRQFHTKNILGVYRDESSLMLSYLVSLLSGKPLFIYLTDLYAENYGSKKKQYLQKLIFKRAKCIFCLNQAMKNHYIAAGYKQVEVIPSTVPEILPLRTRLFDGKVFKIAFSGSIIYDRIDLLQMLVKIIGNNPDYHLYLFSPHDINFLKSNNLYASNVSFEFINNPNLLVEKLQECHLLYLPLTFNKPDDQRSYLQLKTCLGTKSYEYMQTGVPILVHSPAEYYTYQFFESSKSAIMLDSSKEEDLNSTMNEIKSNYLFFQEIVKNAHKQLLNHKSKPNLFQLISLINNS